MRPILTLICRFALEIRNPCIGSTFQPGWREVLMQLAALDDGERIDPFWGEQLYG